MTELTHPLTPDWVSPPGDTIADRIEELGWSQRELAERLGYTTKHVSMLINGRAPITEETAVRLERVLGSTVRFWLEREAQYRDSLIKQEQISLLSEQADWLKVLPTSDMIAYGWIQKFTNKGLQVAECLRFFGVATVEAWRLRYANAGAAFRSSETFAKDGAAVGAWLRQGEVKAAELSCEPFDQKKFKAVLKELRSLTNESDPAVFVPTLIRKCGEAGVAVVFEPAPKKCPVSGAARWLNKRKALIQLSLRHRSNDHLWFSFFHEAGHIALHSKSSSFIDIDGSGLDDEKEKEADRFARDILIPPRDAQRLYEIGRSAAAVEAFSKEIGIAPGIVVGRMQKEGLLPWSHLNGLKTRYELKRRS
ncbi:HigA family addiction module antidote protein [Billgrantia antri]|uniref:HigA family addiction module antidote protein n=1 Tax=Halomonas sulfidivorans TaxID=2733488 RepID=A0ABX7WKL2_9GAMM|nr:HigA family addiction module antitoxin [Halomonas sulfidivorans]QTP60903.1 HigA family addiction module antidote protein [Halomonas sulfidivorans]